MALAKLGANRITSLSDGSPEARLASDLWTHVVNDLLSGSNWPFARRRVELALSTRKPAHTFEYQHIVPQDWLRTLELFPTGDGTGRLKHEYLWDDEDGFVVQSNSSSLYMTYIQDISERTGQWPFVFQEAVASELAFKMTIALTNSVPLHDRMEKEARIKRARAMGATEQQELGDVAPIYSSWEAQRAI